MGKKNCEFVKFRRIMYLYNSINYSFLNSANSYNDPKLRKKKFDIFFVKLAQLFEKKKKYTLTE